MTEVRSTNNLWQGKKFCAKCGARYQMVGDKPEWQKGKF
jgi:hypothetical protein